MTRFIIGLTLQCQEEAAHDLCPLSRKNNPVSGSHMICGTTVHFSQKLCQQKENDVSSSEVIVAHAIKGSGLNHHCFLEQDGAHPSLPWKISFWRIKCPCEDYIIMFFQIT